MVFEVETQILGLFISSTTDITSTSKIKPQEGYSHAMSQI